MRKGYVFLGIFMAAALALGGCSGSGGFAPPPPAARAADLVIVNARAFTCSERQPWATEVAVRDGAITAVGEASRTLVGPGTRVIDAEGRMLTPGFVDNHCHVLWMGALQSLMAYLYDAANLDELRAQVLHFAAENPGNPFVMGIGFRLAYLPAPLPDRHMADAILAERPLILWGNGGHTGWVNTMALQDLQERNPTAFQRLSPVRDDGTGEYTGAFLHFYAFNPMDFYTAQELPPDLVLRMMDAMALSVREANKMGVTTIHDVQIYRPFLPLLLAFAEAGGLDTVRARCAMYVDAHALEDEAALREDLEAWIQAGEDHASDRLELGRAVKLYMDGHAGNHTSFLLEPYSDMPESHGEALWSSADFDRVVEIADSYGLQACTHATGDAAIRRVVDSYAKVQLENGGRDSRHRVEHAELVDPAEMPRMARLGVLAAMQPSHFFGIDLAGETSLGPERVQRMMAWRSLRDSGTQVSGGSDWVAAPVNPLYGLYFGTLRVNYKGEGTWCPEEALPVADLLRQYTIESARAMFWEDRVGSLEEGKKADMVLFDLDLMDVTTWGVPLNGDVLGKLDDKVRMTIVDGKVVYERE